MMPASSPGGVSRGHVKGWADGRPSGRHPGPAFKRAIKSPPALGPFIACGPPGQLSPDLPQLASKPLCSQGGPTRLRGVANQQWPPA